MNSKKLRLQKQLAAVAIVIALAAAPLSKSFARENEPVKPVIHTGIASWYHDKFVGRKTASGDVFSQKKFTCASNKYPLGTWLKVSNAKNGKYVIVRVNDRMNPGIKRSVDLSKAAAVEIGIKEAGLGQVKIQSYGKHKPSAG